MTLQARTTVVVALAAVLICGILPARTAKGAWGQVLKQAPAHANAVVILDVGRLLDSPVGESEGWRQSLADAYAIKPVSVPPSSTRLAIAALLDPGTFDPTWEVAVLEAKDAPSIEAIARAERGFVDSVRGRSAAWSPIDAYYVQLDSALLGIVHPANRQFIARWLRQKHSAGGGFASSYLRNAAAAAGKGADVIMAVDLEDAWCTAEVLDTLQREPYEALKGKSDQLATVAELAGALKCVTLKIKVDQEITGEGIVEFGSDAAPLRDIGKALLLEVLARSGMYIKDFEKWNVSVAGRKMSLNGTLSIDGFDRLVSFIEVPTTPPKEFLSAQPREPEPDEPEAAESGEADVTKATQEYFAAIMKVLDRLNKMIGTGADGASLAKSSGWLQRDARRIERLPILHVDPQLVEWSAEVSSRLSEIADIADVGSIRTRSRTAGKQSYVWGGYGRRGGEIRRGHRRVLSGQRRQAALDEKARTYEAAGRVWQDLRGSAAKMRIELTQRYGVEF